jgi:4-hydroxybenzoate polyprenyltransferase
MRTLLDWEKAFYITVLVITTIIRTLYVGYNEELSWLSLIAAIVLISTSYFYEVKNIGKEKDELDHEGENVFKYKD